MKDKSIGLCIVKSLQHPGKKINLSISVLDLVMVNAGSSPKQSMQNSLDLARHVERWGYNRYWLAEHHNIPGIASAANLSAHRVYCEEVLLPFELAQAG